MQIGQRWSKRVRTGIVAARGAGLSQPKVLVAGAWVWPWYHEACARAFADIGCDVREFRWWPYVLKQDDHGAYTPRSAASWAQLQLSDGPAIRRLNRDLIKVAEEEQPDLVFFYSPTLIRPASVEAVRRAAPRAVIAQYTNDNPFGRQRWPNPFRHVIQGIPHCDVHFVYRRENIREFLHKGAKQVELLRSYFIPEQDYRVSLGAEDDRFANDIVFAGHFEDDSRLSMLEALARSGVQPAVFGPRWQSVRLRPDSPLRARPPMAAVVGLEYQKAISGAKIALCFLSRINHDTYTRRNFQIPAMGTFQLSEYTDDLATLFEEEQEIVFFRSPEELVDKAQFYLRHDALRERIALAGQRRIWSDSHDVNSRMQEVLNATGLRASGGACSSDRRSG